jgi:hypothetical protein
MDAIYAEAVKQAALWGKQAMEQMTAGNLDGAYDALTRARGELAAAMRIMRRVKQII